MKEGKWQMGRERREEWKMEDGKGGGLGGWVVVACLGAEWQVVLGCEHADRNRAGH